MKDVGWLERAQFIFLIFHTFVCEFGRVEAAAWEKKIQTNVRKIRKLTECLLSNQVFKLGEHNLLLDILTLRFINCVKFNFGKNYFSSDPLACRKSVLTEPGR